MTGRTPREPGKRSRAWFARDTRRKTTGERGYDAAWQEASKQYRRRNPLCVPCLLVGRVRAVGCVDHIVPIHSCPELRMEVENVDFCVL
jgi:5-methylcytosine-specific restriction endonuclease McrA